MENAESRRMQLNLYISPSAAGTTTQALWYNTQLLHSADIPLQILEDKKEVLSTLSHSIVIVLFTCLWLLLARVIVEKSQTKAGENNINPKTWHVFYFFVFHHITKQLIYEGGEVNHKHLVASVSNLSSALCAICFPLWAYVRSLTQHDLPRWC